MENATHALLIAGGILFALLTLSLLVYMFNNMALMQNAKTDKKEAEALADWNMQWESYNKQYLYGLEVLTVINKAEDNNNQYNNSEEYKVIIEVEGKEVNGNTTIKTILMKENKTKLYTCIGIEFNPNGNGRVYKMKFEETN